MRAKVPKLIGTALLLFALAPGCQNSAPSAPLPVRRQEVTDQFLLHPEFPAAARVAPHLIDEMLATIRRQATELAAAGK